MVVPPLESSSFSLLTLLMESESDFEDDEIAQMEARIRALEDLLGSAEEEFLLSPRDETAEHEALSVLMQYQSDTNSEEQCCSESSEVAISSEESDDEPLQSLNGTRSATAAMPSDEAPLPTGLAPRTTRKLIYAVKELQKNTRDVEEETRAMPELKRCSRTEGRKSAYVSSDESYSDYISEDETSEDVGECSLSYSDAEGALSQPPSPQGHQGTPSGGRVLPGTHSTAEEESSRSSDDGVEGQCSQESLATVESSHLGCTSSDDGTPEQSATNIDNDAVEETVEDGRRDCVVPLPRDEAGGCAGETEKSTLRDSGDNVIQAVSMVEFAREEAPAKQCGDSGEMGEAPFVEVPDKSNCDNAENEELRAAEERLEARIAALEQMYGMQSTGDDCTGADEDDVSPSHDMVSIRAERLHNSLEDNARVRHAEDRQSTAIEEAERTTAGEDFLCEDIPPAIFISVTGDEEEEECDTESPQAMAMGQHSMLPARDDDGSGSCNVQEQSSGCKTASGESERTATSKASTGGGSKTEGEEDGQGQSGFKKEKSEEQEAKVESQDIIAGSPVAVTAVLKSPGRAAGKIAALALSFAAQSQDRAHVGRSPSPSLSRRTGNLSSIRNRYEYGCTSGGTTPAERKEEAMEGSERCAPPAIARVVQLTPETETRSRRNSIRQMQQQGLLPKPVMLKKKFDEIAAEELERTEAEQGKDLAAKSKLGAGSSPARQDLIAMQRQEVFKSIIARGREVFSVPEPEPETVPKGKRLSSYTRAAPSGRKLPARYRNSKRLSTRGGVDQSVMLAILERRKKEDEEREALVKQQQEQEERKREERRRREEEQAKMFRSALKRKVVHRHERRLIWCKGRRRVYARIVPCTCASLNQGDTFVLDDDNIIYVWCGEKSNRMEKAKGAAIARIIKDHERNSHAKIVTLDQYSDEGEQASFLSLLAGTREDIGGHEEGGDDEKWDQRMREVYQLFGVEDDGSTVLLEPAAKGISMRQLVTERCFVLDTETELFWWAGKKAPGQLLRLAEDAANSIAEQRGITAVKVPEGTEPLLFREKFVDWPDLSHPVVVKRTWGAKKKADAAPAAPPFHPKQMLLENREEKLASEGDKRPVSDGHGELEMWVVDGFRKKPYQGRVGSFHSGNCYIIHYRYRFSETERHAIYYWQGSDKNRTETGACSLLTTELYQHLRKRNDVLVAETEQELQGLESEHFITIFNADVVRRGMVVHVGRSGDAAEASVRLYHVKEVSPTCPNGPAVEVDLSGAPVASCLNSRHCFVVVAEEGTFLWCGQGSSEKLRVHAEALAPLVEDSPEAVTVLKEGEETVEWLHLLGYKDRAEFRSSYACDDELAMPQRVTSEIPAKPRPERRLSSLPVPHSLPEYSYMPAIARLFHCSQLTGKWAAVELLRFSQGDLKETDGYILESSSGVFAWTGAKSNGICKSWTRRTAEEYAALRKAQGAALVYREEASGKESLLFRSHFHAWRPSGDILPPTPKSPAPHGPVVAKESVSQSESSQVKEGNLGEIYPLVELQTSRSLPDYVVRAKEQFLSEADFESVFKMSKEQFNGLAAWRKLHLKKANKLF